jgi:hypothetical protein
MVDRSQETIIIVVSISSFILCCFFKCYRDVSREKQLKNIAKISRKNLLLKNKIKPIIEITEEEVKDSLVEYQIRTPQITGEENV